MNKISLPLSHGSLDSVGASLSILCAIHCIAIPLLIAVLPLWGVGLLPGEGVGRGFLVCGIIFATGSLCWGFRLHRRWRGIFALTAGATMILAGQFHDEREVRTAFQPRWCCIPDGCASYQQAFVS
jgi:hypothetical protein